MTFRWDDHYARRTSRMSSSAIRELLKVTEQPDFISFAGGLPAPEVFPVAEVAEAAARILAERGPQALQYGATEGYRPLRELVAARMTHEGVPATADNVLITTGSQQALDLIGKVFVDPGNRLLVESPTYLAALQAWNTYGAKYLEAPADADGLHLDGLDALLARAPKFLYCLPNFQNPAGVTLAASRRAPLVELAARHGVPLVEDDPYRELRFEGAHLPRLIQLDAARFDDHPYRGGVIYIATFSKILSPGLRVGWVIAAPEVIAKLTLAKQSADLHTATFNQMLAYELARDGFLERHTDTIVRAYRQRRDAMLAALAREFPAGVTWTHPQGGMFLWVTLPPGIDAADVLRDAIAHKVAFVPGAPFHPGHRGANTFRLNFSNASPADIREGVARLGEALRVRLAVAVPA
ncbi:MAG TPA: PLP-dependent aminotransferase family protein [Ktedonobacterales bacterium]|nr:PLP-dependent aminotransferase family protein [Ktedonobacterales bacterium]